MLAPHFSYVANRFACLLNAAFVVSAVPSSVVGQDCCEPVSWVFDRSTYSHDPATGDRVAQYSRIAPVEELPDPRLVTSGYRRTRTNIRGADGSIDSYYQVQSYGNGRGGLDAEWERFHDAWQQSYLSGGYFNSGPAYGQGGPRYGYGGPGYGPGHGYGPGTGHGFRPPVGPPHGPQHGPAGPWPRAGYE